MKGGGRGGERRNGNVIGGRNNEPEGEGRVGGGDKVGKRIVKKRKRVEERAGREEKNRKCRNEEGERKNYFNK